MKEFRIDELSALAVHAQATGQCAELLEWWRDVALVGLTLAVRARAQHIPSKEIGSL